MIQTLEGAIVIVDLHAKRGIGRERYKLGGIKVRSRNMYRLRRDMWGCKCRWRSRWGIGGSIGGGIDRGICGVQVDSSSQ